MPSPAANVRLLGSRLLELEADGPAEPDAAVEAAERVARKLGHPLSRLIGAAGYHALLKRALHMAARELPSLRTVQPLATGDGGLDGLRAAVEDVAPERARAALAELFAQLLWLLVTFIGESLTIRTLRQVWPELELDQGNPGPEEATV